MRKNPRRTQRFTMKIQAKKKHHTDGKIKKKNILLFFLELTESKKRNRSPNPTIHSRNSRFVHWFIFCLVVVE
jgi:hypothetical protein